jgi:hypothetical protein
MRSPRDSRRPRRGVVDGANGIDLETFGMPSNPIVAGGH